MELTEAQYARIASALPVQRGNVRLSNLQVLNAILSVAEQGCKWRGVPQRFGNWHTVYTRMNRWAKNGVLDRVFAHLQREQLLRIKLEAVSLDSPIVKVHPDGTGALKKSGPQAIGQSRGGWTPTLHLAAANERTARRFSLSPGQAHDAPAGRTLLQGLGPQPATPALVRDRAYEGQATRHLAVALGVTPVVPPRQNRLAPWAYDRPLYTRRHEVERLFRRLKGFRRIVTRVEKLDVLFLGFIVFALIFEALREGEQALV